MDLVGTVSCAAADADSLSPVGVLSIILHCPPVAYTSQHDVLLETLDFLLSIQTPTGDLPWSYADWDRLGAQWFASANSVRQ